MHIIGYILTGMFLVGGIGSLIVVLITTVEDLEVLFTKDEPVAKASGTAPVAEPLQQH